MPEGDTLYRVARTLHKALAGHVVRRFDSAYVTLLRIDEEAPIVGRTVERVEARGKWCLIWLSARDPGPAPPAQPVQPARPLARPLDGRLALCTHLRMNGMWHIYRAGRPALPGSGGAPVPDEAWKRPRGDMRVLLATDTFVAVGFRVPVAELLTEAELGRHGELSQLGPDLLAESFDEAEALRRMRRPGLHTGAPRELGDVLLDQGSVAGLGNVYKSELCFLVGVNPFTPVCAVPDEVLKKILQLGQRLLRENVYYQRDPASEVVTRSGMRRTTSAMDPQKRLWVYGRDGQPCRRCAAPIRQHRQGQGARVTFFCPRCQPLPAPAARVSPS
ncbi:MAG: DNA-formamidopyrimidine glycosylase family protein [Polyangia bacterium]